MIRKYFSNSENMALTNKVQARLFHNNNFIQKRFIVMKYYRTQKPMLNFRVPRFLNCIFISDMVLLSVQIKCVLTTHRPNSNH